MASKGTTERCPTCGSGDKSFFINPFCNALGKYDPWHLLHSAPSAPQPEPVRELVEALSKAIRAHKFVREEFPFPCGLPQEIYEQVNEVIKAEAERVLARYQK